MTKKYYNIYLCCCLCFSTINQVLKFVKLIFSKYDFFLVMKFQSTTYKQLNDYFILSYNVTFFFIEIIFKQ